MVEVLFWSTLIVVGWKFIFPTVEWGDICRVIYGFDLAVFVIYILVDYKLSNCIRKYGSLPFFSKYICNKGYCVCSIPRVLDIIIIDKVLMDY